MIERPNLPSNYVAISEQLIDSFEWDEPDVGELVQGARETARSMSKSLVLRLHELGASPGEQMFHDMPLEDGSIRVAITPADEVYRSFGTPVWRIVINQGSSKYHNARPREQWDIMDILLQPKGLRLGEKHARILNTLGYGETQPPPGYPPRIIRDVYTSRYSLSSSQGYTHTLPEVPLLAKGDRLAYYQRFSTTASTALDVLRKLSEVTRVEAVPNLEQQAD